MCVRACTTSMYIYNLQVCKHVVLHVHVQTNKPALCLVLKICNSGPFHEIQNYDITILKVPPSSVHCH